MESKPRADSLGTLFRSPAGEEWRLGAEGLKLVEGDQRTSFDDYHSLFEEAGDRISARTKAGFRMVGDVAARAAGVHNQVTPEQVARLRPQFGPRRSIFMDAWSELEEVLQDPEGYEGGVLVFEGNVTIPGSWDAGDYAAVVVLGDCSVNGLLYQYQTEPWFLVTGDLVAENLIMAGNLDVGGSIRVARCAEFESGDGYAHAGGDITAPTVMVWDMPVTCTKLSTDLYVSRCDFVDRVVCEDSMIGHCLAELHGSETQKYLHPCFLYEGDSHELRPERSKLISLLGLPVRADS